MPNEYAAVVLGGGPAGALCALRLADRGVRTLLVDKATFPRAKVCGCCLNLAGVDVLGQMGLGQLPAQLGAVELHHWHIRYARKDIRCPLPGGFAVSRYRLDEALIRQAAAAGATVRTGTVGTIETMTDDQVSVRLESVPAGEETPTVETVTASMAIIATGLAGGGLERWLPYQKRPSGPFGAGLTLSSQSDAYPLGTIFMACHRDGYVGAVRLEDGTLDVAAALMPATLAGKTLARDAIPLRIAQMMREAGFPTGAHWEQQSSRARTTPRLRRSRLAGNGRLIAIGDAAQYVEPFTGEGMAWAMKSGLVAADMIAERSGNGSELMGDHWLQTCQNLLRRRQWPCRLITTALQSDLGRRTFFGSLHRMPWLAKPVIRYMNQAQSA